MAMLVSSRRYPYPYDVQINGIGFMLKPDADGQLIAKQAQPMQATPTSYDYGSASPFLEITFAFKEIFGGFGQAVQNPHLPSIRHSGVPARSYYCIDTDMSVNGKAIKGPLFHREVVTSGGTDNAIRGIVKALDSGSETIFILAGRKVYKGDGSGTWTQSVDLPTLTGNGSILPTGSTARFKDAGAAPIDSLYLGVNFGNMVRYNGTTWLLSATGTPTNTGTPALLNNQAQFYETVGNELWVGANNYIAKVEAEPYLASKYAGPIAIGNASRSITWLRQNQNELFIFKQDGVYTVSTAGLDQELFPGLRITPNPDNGVNTVAWLNSLWVPFHDNFFKLEPDGSIQNIGSELLLDNLSEVRGRIIAGSGHNSWAFYEGVYNEQLGHSYLLKYGSWYDSEDELSPTPILFKTVHNGALKKWTNKRITWLGVINFSPNDRLYAGFSDGTIEWCVLPRVPNPAADPNYRFTDTESYVYLPRHHAGFESDQKITRGFSGYGNLSNQNHLEIEYRTDSGTDFLPLATLEQTSYTLIRSGFDGVANGTNTFVATSGAFSSVDLNRDIVVNGSRRQISLINSGNSVDFTGDPIPAGTSLPWSINASAKAHFVTNSQRIDFPVGQITVGKSIDIRYKLMNKINPSDAADTTSSPVVDGIGIHEQMRPAFIVEWTMTFLAKNFVAKNDGSVDRRPANQLRQSLLDFVASIAPVTVGLPHEEDQEISMIDYAESHIPNSKRHGIEWEITIKGVEFRTLTSATSGVTPPTGLTYDQLEQYTYDQLESLI